VFASNFVVTVLAEADRLFEAAGISDRSTWLPLTRAGVDGVERMGTAAALTGPAVRGDAGAIESNLRALASDAPDAVAVYAALTAAALDLAERSGRLAPEGRRAVEEVLARWR
jgi:predicted short-subunit dehydrogenase-like oxidoreductase (DUF2520 family)